MDEDEVRLAPRKWGPSDLLAHANGEKGPQRVQCHLLAPSEPVPCIASATGVRVAGATTKSCM